MQAPFLCSGHRDLVGAVNKHVRASTPQAAFPRSLTYLRPPGSSRLKVRVQYQVKDSL